MPTEPNDPDFMLSLARGLAVLKAFELQSSLTVGQAAKIAGFTRSSAGRCLYTLAKLGYVEDHQGSYRLTPAMLPLSSAYVISNPLARAAQPILNAVRDRIGESSSLGVLDRSSKLEKVVYVCRAETTRIIAIPLSIGSSLPSYCTSMGRVLLAAQPQPEVEAFLNSTQFPKRTAKTLTSAPDLNRAIAQVREQDWSLIDEELELGLRSIAVGVRNQAGKVVAAINVSAQTRSYDVSTLVTQALPELRAAAAHLSRMGF